MQKFLFFICTFVAVINLGCASTPKLDPEKIRQWCSALENEYPVEKAVLASYKEHDFELNYLAARHSTAMGSDTLNLVETLFRDFKFNVLLIESIPHSSGESPKWFIEEAKRGAHKDFIEGGESAFSVINAEQRGIPFFAGEPDHQDIFHGLKAKGYSDIDVLGFYSIRQIPQWVREKENLFTQKMSVEIAKIRDHFTLDIIETLLKQYKKVAVVYGAGHFLTLRKSFDSYFGEPTFTEDKQSLNPVK